MDGLDSIEIRILKSISDRRYHSRSEIHSWVVDDLPSIAILQNKLDILDIEGLIKFETGRGYIRTNEGTFKTKLHGETIIF